MSISHIQVQTVTGCNGHVEDFFNGHQQRLSIVEKLARQGEGLQRRYEVFSSPIQ